MTSTEKSQHTGTGLRQCAEKIAHEQARYSADQLADLPLDVILQTVYELRVHQIELEMQNDELRRTQEALEAAQAFYFDFYDLAPVGYITVSKHGLILQANLTAAHMLSASRNALLKQAISRFICKEDQDIYYRLQRKLSESPAPQSCELRLNRKDNKFSVRLDAIAAKGDDGALVFRMVLIDVTEQNKILADSAVTRERETFKQAILNSVNAEIAVLDLEGIIQAVNEPWKRFSLENSTESGMPAPHTGIGANYLAACRSDIDDSTGSALLAKNGIRKVLDGSLPSFTLEYPCHSPTQQRWFSMCVLPLQLDTKCAVTVTHTNITAHKQAEEFLRIAAAAFEVQEAIMVMDSQRKVLRVNQAFTDITGYSEQDVRGQTMVHLRSLRIPDSSYEDIWRKTAENKSCRINHLLQRKNGEDVLVRGTVTAVQNELGNTTQYVISFSDQTLAMAQKQQRLQEEASQREALVQEVHHRVKNNLQGIRGLLQRLAAQRPEIAESMQVAIGQLQGVSVIHGLQGNNNKSRVHLCELVSEIAQAASTLWKIPIPVAIPDNWIARIVNEKDAVSMALVLNELIVNAIKHGGKAHGHVSITLRQGGNIEGADITILNAGHLSSNIDRPKERHYGQQLIESLRPRDGVSLTLTQDGDQVCTLLVITAPVIFLEMANPT